ncbi:MAG: PQQ-binding-like beta-propeller repeat protein, partial [Bacteroidetes bacterium]|nr:PQQ-binding-like beta-propeller repeat protein [Bacteroidota bacterium]
MKKLYLPIVFLLLTFFNANAQATLKWSIPSINLPSFGASSSTPVIMNDSLYWQGEDGGMACIDAQTGDILWSFEAPFKPIIFNPVGHKGIIYTSNDSTYIAVNGKDGSIKWSASIIQAHEGTPILDSMIYVADDSTIYCLSIHTGKEIWRRTQQSTYLLMRENRSELLTTDQTNVAVVALNPLTGQVKWALPLSDDSTILSTMATNGDFLIVAPGSNMQNAGADKFYGINLNTQLEVWVKDSIGFCSFSPPVIMGNMAYVSTKFMFSSKAQRVRALNMTNGDTVWSKPSRYANLERTPFITALQGRVIFENSEFGGPFPISYVCLNGLTGDTAWTTAGNGIPFYSTAGGLLVYDGKLYGAMDL